MNGKLVDALLDGGRGRALVLLSGAVLLRLGFLLGLIEVRFGLTNVDADLLIECQRHLLLLIWS